MLISIGILARLLFLTGAQEGLLVNNNRLLIVLGNLLPLPSLIRLSITLVYLGDHQLAHHLESLVQIRLINWGLSPPNNLALLRLLFPP